MDYVCGDAEHEGFCACGCSYYLPLDDERESEATAGQLIMEGYTGIYGQEKRYSL
jgi:hypothetical protein